MYNVDIMKLNERVQGKIEKVDSKGHGVMMKNDKEIVSFFTVPGDEVELMLIKRRKGQLYGRIEKILSPSPARVEPRCSFVGKCGGCPWQMVDYAKQVEYKRDLVNNTFRDHKLPFSVKSVEPCKELFYFRNRMDYVFGSDGELGLKEPEKWWSTLDLDVCFLLSESAVRVMETVRAWAKEHKLAGWDNQKYQGLLRYLVIREGKFTNERMATLITSAEDFPKASQEDLIAKLQNLTTSLYWGVNPKTTDVSLAEDLRLLSGKRYLTEKINNLSFDIHPNSFFQTNSLMAGRLMEVVREFAGLSENEQVLDLYCGVGFFGIGLAKSAKEVVGIELDAQAIELAKENARANGIENATFLTGSAEEMLPKMPRPDVVIVDPPRSGLHPRVLKTLMALSPKRIVYVSCNYSVLARELPTFLEDYEIQEMTALDLFPHTPHVEIITSLKKKL